MVPGLRKDWPSGGPCAPEARLWDRAVSGVAAPRASRSLTCKLRPLVLRSAFRSAYPFDRNDSAVWTGKGFSAALGGGIRYETDRLRLVLHPLVAFHQNASFGVATTGRQTHPLAHPYQSLDWPQRLGEGAFTTIDPGQSVLAVKAGPAELALATENLWWGPARRYPILLV